MQALRTRIIIQKVHHVIVIVIKTETKGWRALFTLKGCNLKQIGGSCHREKDFRKLSLPKHITSFVAVGGLEAPHDFVLHEVDASIVKFPFVCRWVDLVERG